MFGVQRIHDFEQHFPENLRHSESVSLKPFWRAVLLHHQDRAVKSLENSSIKSLTCRATTPSFITVRTSLGDSKGKADA